MIMYHKETTEDTEESLYLKNSINSFGVHGVFLCVPTFGCGQVISVFSVVDSERGNIWLDG